MWVEFLFVLSFAPRGFSPGSPVVSSHLKPTFSNSKSTGNQVDEVPLSGCVTSKSLLFSFVHRQLSTTTSFICLNENIQEAMRKGLVPANDKFLQCVVVEQRNLQGNIHSSAS